MGDKGRNRHLVDLARKVNIPKQGTEVRKDDSKIWSADVVISKICREPKNSVLEPERKELGVKCLANGAPTAAADKAIIDNVHRNTDRFQRDLFKDAFDQRTRNVIFGSILIHQGVPQVQKRTHRDETINCVAE